MLDVRIFSLLLLLLKIASVNEIDLYFHCYHKRDISLFRFCAGWIRFCIDSLAVCFSCLASRWRPHPRGDVPPRLPLEPLRRPTQQNINHQLAVNLDSCRFIVHEQRQPSTSCLGSSSTFASWRLNY